MKAVSPQNFFEPFKRRVLYFCFGAFLLLVSFPMSYQLFTNAPTPQSNAVFVSLFMATVLLCGVGLVMTALRLRLTLTERTLTLRRAFSITTINRSDISGCSQSSLGGINTLFVFSPRKKRAILRIPNVFEDGEKVVAWLNGYSR